MSILLSDVAPRSFSYWARSIFGHSALAAVAVEYEKESVSCNALIRAGRAMPDEYRSAHIARAATGTMSTLDYDALRAPIVRHMLMRALAARARRRRNISRCRVHARREG